MCCACGLSILRFSSKKKEEKKMIEKTNSRDNMHINKEEHAYIFIGNFKTVSS